MIKVQAEGSGGGLAIRAPEGEDGPSHGPSLPTMVIPDPTHYDHLAHPYKMRALRCRRYSPFLRAGLGLDQLGRCRTQLCLGMAAVRWLWPSYASVKLTAHIASDRTWSHMVIGMGTVIGTAIAMVMVTVTVTVRVTAMVMVIAMTRIMGVFTVSVAVMVIVMIMVMVL